MSIWVLGCTLATMLETGEFIVERFRMKLTRFLREHNMVRFHNGTPVGVYYSQHVDGVGFKWDDQRINVIDGRV